MLRATTMRCAIVAGLVPLLGGCGTAATPAAVPSPTAQTHTINGKVEVITSDGCGQGGYSDIDTRGSVTITNENCTVFGAGSLTQQPTTGQFSEVTCDYTFTADHVPDANFYGVAVGHRNPVQYSASEMRQNDWNVSLSVGG
jgi:hypothetical protein